MTGRLVDRATLFEATQDGFVDRAMLFEQVDRASQCVLSTGPPFLKGPFSDILNSPGLWPKGVLENQSMLFLVIPPYPPAESLGEKCLRLRPGQSVSEPLGTTFFQFFSNVFFDLISGCVLVPKTSKSSSKIQLKSYLFTTLGRLVFRA